MPHTNPAFGNYQLKENGLWLSDNTIANATSSRHGFAPKLSGAATDYLDGSGAWSVPAGAGSEYMYPYGDAITWIGNDNFRGAAIDTTGARFAGAQSWVAENIAGATIAVGDGLLRDTAPTNATLQIKGYCQPVPAGTAWRVKMPLSIRPVADTSQRAIGMFLRDGGGKIEWMAIGYSGGALLFWAANLTDFDSYNATRTTLGTGLWPNSLEIEFDNTNYYYRFSHTTQLGVFLTSFAKANFLAVAATHIGFFSASSATQDTTLMAGGFYQAPISSVF